MSTDVIQALVLGVIQGVTEFLPISSSAHLLVIPWLLGWTHMGLTFDVVLHSGTLLALLVYFRREWRELLWWGSSQASELSCLVRNRLRIVLLIGTLPGVCVGIFLEDIIEHQLRNPMVTVVTLFCFGLFLWLADRLNRQTRNLKDISLRDGLIVGAAQALALMPGVSRSGITMTAGRLLGFSRAEAARFSFLLGTPIIALATLSRVKEVGSLGALDFSSILPFIVGVTISFVSGLLCIKYLLKFLKSRSYFSFAVYRVLLAALIFWLL